MIRESRALRISRSGDKFEVLELREGGFTMLAQCLYYIDADRIINALRSEGSENAPSSESMTLHYAAKGLHDYLWANVPDILDISTSSQLAGDGLTKRLQALKDAMKLPVMGMSRPASAAWDAALESAANEVESHWNHIDTDVNQRDQAIRSAAAIRKMKRLGERGGT